VLPPSPATKTRTAWKCPQLSPKGFLEEIPAGRNRGANGVRMLGATGCTHEYTVGGAAGEAQLRLQAALGLPRRSVSEAWSVL